MWNRETEWVKISKSEINFDWENKGEIKKKVIEEREWTHLYIRKKMLYMVIQLKTKQVIIEIKWLQA